MDQLFLELMSAHSPSLANCQGGGSSGQVWWLPSWFLFCALLLNIASNCFKGHLANGPCEIRTMPENRLPVESFYVVRECVPNPS